MQTKKIAGTAGMLLLALNLVSCNIGKSPEPTPDVNAIYTSAAETTVAQFNLGQTQTAQAASPTPAASPTSLPTFTPLPTFPVGNTGTTPIPGITPLASPIATAGSSSTASGCDDSAFIADVSIPDGTVMKPGEDFKKSWTIQNTGTCQWDDGYALVYQGGTLDGYDVAIKKTSEFVAPGATQTFSVNLTASLTPKEYIECWKMRNDRGAYFGTYVCVDIVVKK